MPNSFMVEIVVIIALIASWYVKEFFGLSMKMYIGFIFLCLFVFLEGLWY